MLTRASRASPNNGRATSITRGPLVRDAVAHAPRCRRDRRQPTTAAAVHAPADVPSIGPEVTGMPASVNDFDDSHVEADPERAASAEARRHAGRRLGLRSSSHEAPRSPPATRPDRRRTSRRGRCGWPRRPTASAARGRPRPAHRPRRRRAAARRPRRRPSPTSGPPSRVGSVPAAGRPIRAARAPAGTPGSTRRRRSDPSSPLIAAASSCSSRPVQVNAGPAMANPSSVACPAAARPRRSAGTVTSRR